MENKDSMGLLLASELIAPEPRPSKPSPRCIRSVNNKCTAKLGRCDGTKYSCKKRK